MTKADVYAWVFNIVLNILRLIAYGWFPFAFILIVRAIWLRLTNKEDRGWSLFVYAAFMIAVGVMSLFIWWWVQLPDAPVVNVQ